MKILHINEWDSRGGAAIATSRLHTALLNADVDSKMLVARAKGDIPQVELQATGWRFQRDRILERGAQWLGKFQKDPTQFTCSLNLRPNNLVARIHEIDPDIVHLHWVGGGMLRIEDLPKIKRPIVWTFQDMWPFCGTEHYNMGIDARWQKSYSAENRPAGATGPDWARYAWQRKRKHWQNVPLTTISPSRWMRDCAADSALFKGRTDCKHVVIANSLDTEMFKPCAKQTARQRLGLSETEPFVVFGAFAQISPMKGGDLLPATLASARKRGLHFGIGMFGFGSLGAMQGYEVTQFGVIDDIAKLVDIYNAADLMLMPSRLESFGQTASESLACGTPVVSFDSSGLRDIVDHKVNGYRAKCYEVESLVDGIEWCLRHQRPSELSVSARAKAVSKFDLQLSAKDHVELYQSLL